MYKVYETDNIYGDQIFLTNDHFKKFFDKIKINKNNLFIDMDKTIEDMYMGKKLRISKKQYLQLRMDMLKNDLEAKGTIMNLNEIICGNVHMAILCQNKVYNELAFFAYYDSLTYLELGEYLDSLGYQVLNVIDEIRKPWRLDFEIDNKIRDLIKGEMHR